MPASSIVRCFAISCWRLSGSPWRAMRLVHASPELAPQDSTLWGPKEAPPPLESSVGPQAPAESPRESAVGPQAPPEARLGSAVGAAPPVEPRHWRVTPFGAAATVLVVLTVATRLPFMTQTLYAFDSANYALAVRDFYNVAFHQPHPPGYPLYVFFAKLINLGANDANRALVLEGVLWSAVAVGCTTLLARAMFGRTVGLLSGALLMATVGFWGYGEVAYPYVALAGETSALAFLAHEVLTGRRTLIIPLGAVWAVSLGVRWDGAIFCLLIALWALWAAHWRLSLASAGLAALIVVAFALPMIALTGGWDVYRQAIRSEE